MRALMGETLLAAWECAQGGNPQRACLDVLALAEPERTAQDWALTPLGERNASLLQLRAASLGRRIDGFASCPECGAHLEFTLDAQELALTLRAQLDAADTSLPALLRPANALDLLAAANAVDEDEARVILLARTLRRNEDDAALTRAWLEEQPQDLIDTLTADFDRINAAAEIRARFNCTGCEEEAAVDIDPALFLLDEIARAGRRLLEDIRGLAVAFGWSEGAILALSASRRSFYLEALRP